MKSIFNRITTATICLGLWLAMAAGAAAQTRDALIGVWQMDEGFQITELLFRSDGRYQLDTRSTNPDLDFSSSERGEYSLNDGVLVLAPFDWFGEPGGKSFTVQMAAGELTLTRTDIELVYTYQFKEGSRDQVLRGEQAPRILIGKWTREIPFAGTAEYTFRPGGYYLLKNSSQGNQFPPEFIRGRYESSVKQLTITPYSGTPVTYELDFFGDTLTLIRREEFSGSATIYERVPGSELEVRTKAAEANAFMARENWLAGVWEVRDPFHIVDITFRPDGHYIASEQSELLAGIVRGGYTLAGRTLHLNPFVGQGLYARSNGEFGKVERTRELDYYDGELQFIDTGALSQSVTLARKRAGSETAVIAKTQAAQAELQQPGWWIGIWEVNDPAGWMQFTFRPDGRYIAKSGQNGSPSAVERGEYLVRAGKLSLSPYLGQGPARGFELDFYDGDLFLAGDLQRLVVARKVPGSAAEVTQKTTDPSAMKGDLGGILGLWTAHMPGYSADLVFRPDGEFRLERCSSKSLSRDYGLYAVDMNARTLLLDSRFSPAQTLGLDFYGDTMTIYGSPAGPSTYKVNTGLAAAAIEASLAADAAEAEVDAAWLARIPIAPRDPGAIQQPSGDIPADPFPGRILDSPVVFRGYQLYRRLILGTVYFRVQDTIKSVPVVNTREWHFFPTGRVMVRFKNYYAAPIYPNTLEEVTISWGAYRITPKPNLGDVLHRYADNVVLIEMDSGEQAEMTLEDGRRNLFWGRDYQIQWEWAAEQKPVPCEPAADTDSSLMNTGVALTTNIRADGTAGPAISILRGNGSALMLHGNMESSATVVVEATAALFSPSETLWQPVSTNNVAAGAFDIQLPQSSSSAAYFRVRVLE